MRFLMYLMAIFVILFILFVFWALGTQREFSHTILTASESSPSPLPKTLKVMTYNIGFGNGLTGTTELVSKQEVETNLAHIATVIQEHDPDILVIQEIDRKSKRSFQIDQVQYLLDQSSFYQVAFGMTWNLNWIPFPYHIDPRKHFGNVVAGQAVFSKFPIIDHSVHTFQKPASNFWIYNLFYLNRVFQRVTLQLSPTKTLRLGHLHLEAYDVKTRESQADFILSEHRQAPYDLILGDFNAIEPNALRQHGFVDEPDVDYRADSTLSLFRQTPNLSDYTESHLPPLPFTFPADFPTRRLDYIFGLQNRLSLLNSYVVTAPPVSDHLPVVSIFRLE